MVEGLEVVKAGATTADALVGVRDTEVVRHRGVHGRHNVITDNRVQSTAVSCIINEQSDHIKNRQRCNIMNSGPGVMPCLFVDAGAKHGPLARAYPDICQNYIDPPLPI